VDTLAKQLTDALRGSDDADWTRLRQLMHERGVDPQHAVLAEAFPDDEFQEYGIVIARDGRVFQYVFEFPEGDAARGFFLEWNDRSGDWQSVYPPGAVEAGFELLRQEQGERPSA
jgi:hypothetical protein